MSSDDAGPASRDDAILAAAAALWAAQETGQPCAPLRGALAAHGVEAAYRVQEINIARRLSRTVRVIGRKIGLTSPAVQTQLGVNEPDFGVLLSDMVVPDGGVLPAGAVLQPKAEGEIAFVLGADLDTPSPTVADVLRATAFILPAIEIVGSRVANWDIRLLDTVADNASSGMFVLGSPARAPIGFDFADCTMQMTFDGQQVSAGTGRACLGNPLNAVAWLAGRMHAFGAPMRAGEVILSGALGPMAVPAPGAAVEVVISGLGKAAFTVGV